MEHEPTRAAQPSTGRRFADALLLLTWRKLLLIVVVWGLLSAVTWLVYGPDVTLPGGPWQWHRFSAGVGPTLLFLVGGAVVPIYLLVALVYTIVRTQPRSRYLRLNPYTLLLLPAFLLGVVLHNVSYIMFYPFFSRTEGDDAVFFMATLLGLPLYLIVVTLNTLVGTLGGRSSGGGAGHVAPGGSGSR